MTVAAAQATPAEPWPAPVPRSTSAAAIRDLREHGLADGYGVVVAGVLAGWREWWCRQLQRRCGFRHEHDYPTASEAAAAAALIIDGRPDRVDRPARLPHFETLRKRVSTRSDYLGRRTCQVTGRTVWMRVPLGYLTGGPQAVRP